MNYKFQPIMDIKKEQIRTLDANLELIKSMRNSHSLSRQLLSKMNINPDLITVSDEIFDELMIGVESFKKENI